MISSKICYGNRFMSYCRYTIGIFELYISYANLSELKGIKSSTLPPPLANIITSGIFPFLIELFLL